MNSACNEGLSFCLPKWKKLSFLGYMEIWICPATSLLLHVQFAWGNILDRMHKKLSEHCSCLQDLAINRFASGSRQLLSTFGRNPRWKVTGDTLVGAAGEVLSTGSVHKWGFKLWLWDSPLQWVLLYNHC